MAETWLATRILGLLTHYLCCYCLRIHVVDKCSTSVTTWPCKLKINLNTYMHTKTSGAFAGFDLGFILFVQIKDEVKIVLLWYNVVNGLFARHNHYINYLVIKIFWKYLLERPWNSYRHIQIPNNNILNFFSFKFSRHFRNK